MKIAVLLGEIGFISRHDIIEGIRSKVKADGSSVVLFTCEGFLYEHLTDYISGEYNIFSLPDLSEYDGLIVDLPSIQDDETAAQLEKRIIESGVPCVSFDKEIPGAGVIKFDNESGFRKLINHMVEEHKVDDFVYLSGPKDNLDSIQRKEIFLDALSRHNISIGEDRIFEGDFNFITGRSLVNKLVEEKLPLPKAFVAANDFMAIGILKQLNRYGISVPEQVLVTGYDNHELAHLCNPGLTTVDRNEYGAGQMAYDMLGRIMAGDDADCECIVEGVVVDRDSCGCCDTGNREDLGETLVNTRISMDESLDWLKGLSINFSNLDSIDEFSHSMANYIGRIGVDCFYFCQCGSRASYYRELDSIADNMPTDRDVTKFSDTMWCPVAYEDGEWTTYSSFETKNLFPPDGRYFDKPGYYIVMPVHQGSVCIGYSIIGNFREHLSGRMIQHLVLSIDNAIGNIRKQDIMQTMLYKINQKWLYDELTGLYNRSGYRAKAREMITQALEQGKGISVSFFDLDGLKRINDSQGHKAGDQYIKSMADMLSNSMGDGDIAVRFGGDEYIVLAIEESEEMAAAKLRQLTDGIKKPVSASAGQMFDYVKDMIELDRLVEKADSLMYKNKKKKKSVR